VRSLLFRLPADRHEGRAALRDFPRGPFRAEAPGGVLGVLEHGLCAFKVFGPAAGDERARPAGVGAGKEQWRAEPRLDLRGRGEWPSACSYRSRVVARVPRAQGIEQTTVPVRASWPENGAKSS
jgi:hypothetical protein